MSIKRIVMSKRNRKIKQRALFAEQQKEEVLNSMLQFSRMRFKKFDEIILQLYLEADLSGFFADRRVARVYECFLTVPAKTKAVERAIMKNVFVHLHRHSLLFSGEDYIQTAYNMFRFRAHWKNDVFEWKPYEKRGAEQIGELADYLFCLYPVPQFLYKAFFETTNTSFIDWFIHIGTGKKVKDLANMPIPFTQKMGNYFLQVQNKFSIAEGLRWAQVRGLGGDEKLAERIAWSWIGRKNYEHEVFWESFIRTVVNGGMFNHEQLTQLIDYVREMKRENGSYSLKGRTLQSLLRQSDEWHERSLEVRGIRTWSASGLYGYKLEKKLETVKMEELTGSKLLVQEGRTMKHCVATYVHQCVTGKTAIFSMRKYSMDLQTETLATIEVSLSLRRVVQAKAKMNRKISDEARKHLDEWAKKNDLSVSPYL